MRRSTRFLLTTGRGNANGAEIRFWADGARLGADLDGHQRVALIFDGEDADALGPPARTGGPPGPPGMTPPTGSRTARAAGKESVMTRIQAVSAVALPRPLLGACAVEIGGFSFSRSADGETRTASVRASNQEALLQPTAAAARTSISIRLRCAARPAEIALGMGECDLVRLKGERRPTC